MHVKKRKIIREIDGARRGAPLSPPSHLGPRQNSFVLAPLLSAFDSIRHFITKDIGSHAPGRMLSTTRELVDPAKMLWKPVSNGDGMLSVLLPREVSGLVREVQLLDMNGKRIEVGREVVRGTLIVGRINYRFKKPGMDYPAGVTVRIVYNDGSVQDIMQKNPAQRTGS